MTRKMRDAVRSGGRDDHSGILGIRTGWNGMVDEADDAFTADIGAYAVRARMPKARIEYPRAQDDSAIPGERNRDRAFANTALRKAVRIACIYLRRHVT